MRPVVVACCLSILGSVLVRTTSLEAQWRSDSLTNTPVCIAKSAQTHPDIASDGAGGAYVVWQDIRSNYNWDIYAQHISADGEALWGSSGRAICASSFDQYAPIIKSDGLGGAFIVWSSTTTDIYAQHIASDGTLSYGENGIPIGQAVREQREPAMELISPGRAIVAFEDFRAANSAARPDITVNVLTTRGAVHSSNGAEVISVVGGQRHPRLISRMDGTALLAWESDYGLPIGIQASLLDSNGALKWNPGGTAPGINLFRGLSTANDASNISLALSGEKYLLAWEVQNMSGNLGKDIFANRVSKTGVKDWFSALDVTGEWPSDQTDPTIVADDSGGFIVFFEDYGGDIPPRYLNRDIAAVHFRSNGLDRTPNFDDGFFYVTRQSRAQRFYRMVEADNRFYFAWDDARSGSGTEDTSIYAQAIDKALNRFYPSFGTNSSWGKPIANRPVTRQAHVAMCKRTGGGVIIAWSDKRSGDQDIYAQVMFPDGTLPIELSSFDVSAIGEQVTVEWKTAMERDHAGFEVERRKLHGPPEFEVVASYKNSAVLRGSGNTNYEKPYAYTEKPVPGIYEYRIADIALDGTRKTYQAKQINTTYAAPPEWSAIAAYPNPASEKIWVGALLAEASTIEVEVSNLLGQPVLQGAVTQVYSGFSYIELPVDRLINGSYLYRVIAKRDGAVLWTGPLQRFQVVR